MAHLEIGSIVFNRDHPEWGPGKILSLANDKAKIFFRDASEREIHHLKLGRVPLELAPDQHDEVLDKLPPFDGTRFEVKESWVSFDSAVARFQHFFPGGFEDPNYLGLDDIRTATQGERNYKLAAHRQYVETLGGNQAEALLEQGAIEELADRVYAVATENLNLMDPRFEAPSYRSALKGPAGPIARYLTALFDFIGRDEPDESAFKALVAGLAGLQVDDAEGAVTKWPILTLVPFIARPDTFMFVKPQATKTCAERLRRDIKYKPALNWGTYKSVLEMSRWLLGRLAPLGARDFIDVQSFVWVVAEYTESVRLERS